MTQVGREYSRRVRHIKWGILGVAALSLFGLEAYYYWRGVPLLEDVIGWVVGMGLAAMLVVIGFRMLERAHRDTLLEVKSRQEAEEALREGEGHYRALVERSNDGIAILQDHVVTYANRALTRMSGYNFEELASAPFADFIHPDERGRVHRRYERRMAGEMVPAIYGTRLVRKDGSSIWVELNAGLTTHRGRPGDLVVVRDITARKAMEDSLRRISGKMRQLHDTARDLAACDREDRVYEVVAEAAEKTLSFAMCSVDVVEDAHLNVKATSSQLPVGASESRPLAAGGLAAETHRSGRTFLFGSLDEVPLAEPINTAFNSGISVPIGDVGVLQVVSTEHDAFTEEDAQLLEVLARHAASAVQRIRLQAKLERQAMHDPLTDVYNRRFFTETLKQELARSIRYEHAISILMIDVNRFKEINDRFGHQIGDSILQEAASLLRDGVRESDSVVRYGGDEFLIVQPETDSGFEATISRIRAALQVWNASSGLLDFPLTFAIGAARWRPADGRSFEDVLGEADRRMYQDKMRSGA